jgi:hypothetical protein
VNDARGEYERHLKRKRSGGTCPCDVRVMAMGKKPQQRNPFTQDPATLRMLADEADGHRYRTPFGRLDDKTLLRAIAAALRAYADAQEGRNTATRASSSHAPSVNE